MISFVLEIETFSFNIGNGRESTSSDSVEESDFIFNQSSEQAFYFVESLSIPESINNDDWLLAYNNDILVGARKWNGPNTDIPVMGNDGGLYSMGYCEDGDVPIIKLFKSSTGEIVELVGDVPYWNNLGINFISLYNDNLDYTPSDFKISNIYPNPFNPYTNFELEITKSDIIKIDIYDLNGKIVDSLYNGILDRGIYSYIWDASNFTSGIYFITISTSEYSTSQKITLIK